MEIVKGFLRVFVKVIYASLPFKFPVLILSSQLRRSFPTPLFVSICLQSKISWAFFSDKNRKGHKSTSLILVQQGYMKLKPF